ncbi:MAG: FHA domain-containing protein [Planctomycetota bacterium]|nr:FHA domain-containing protein [Planctomycetota bacterium]
MAPDETTIDDPTMETFYGELIPEGGGDPIPLFKKTLLVGRREKCDIVLRFKNVSAHHCQLSVRGGFWHIRDLDSLNGTKVNDVAVTQKRVNPNDKIEIAKHVYRIKYAPNDLGAVGPPPPDEPVSDIMKQSLLQRAGLEKKHQARRQRESRRDVVTDDSDVQLNKPSDD